MRNVIVTGMSGAGKSTVIRQLEDMGYFCVDNIPVELIPTLTKTFINNESIDKVALGIDIRNRDGLKELNGILNSLKEDGYRFEILFMDAKDETLLRRFKETRRNHPLSQKGRIDRGIEEERSVIEFIKENADYIVDTTDMLVRDLKKEVKKIFREDGDDNDFFVTILSFGFKYGIPKDADLVFDVRFLPNPFYEPELKRLTGNDKPVSDFVMASEVAKQFELKLFEMVEFLIPNYINEGKTSLVIAFGCTGGKHRSVTFANELARHMEQLPYTVKVEHVDIAR
ncbi:MAG: RNase adapter RapZ [Lachnospiraceae bacterium]|nr:RNase adapter RapZ [Lachnospiraceae bacterium]